jgi:hypothetical protein
MSLYNPTTHVFDPEIAGIVNATLTTSNGDSAPEYSAYASGRMSYSFELTGAPTDSGFINVLLQGGLSITLGSGDGASLLIYQGLTDNGNDIFQGDPLSAGTISTILSIQIGQPYTVEMQFGIMTVADSFNQLALAQGILDPTLTPPAGYTITYSPNPTPLPASLPLFASSLGFLGFLGWRRKKRMASAG